MANPGFGKRSAPGQEPRRHHDFAHLPAREASVAGYIDRLKDGSDISQKTLAAQLPGIGQWAAATVLRNLGAAGHVRHVREHLVGPRGARWVTRTYFSRTPRNDAWWATFQADALPDDPSDAAPDGDSVPEDEPAHQPPAQAPSPPPSPSPPHRSRAYDTLASLGRTAPAMSLSAADCEALEALAADWFARGADEADLVRALTEGLPTPVHHPAGLARTRLIAKLPPERAPSPPRPPLRMLECLTCGTPGRAETLPGGLCTACQGKPVPVPRAVRPDDVHTHVAHVRAAARPPARTRR
ncbi:hypothetical protein [Streptomyces sannanensis]